jgi:hypothetical protein
MAALHDQLAATATSHRDAIDVLAQFVDRTNELLIAHGPQLRDPNEAARFLRLSPALRSTQTPEEIAKDQQFIDEVIQQERDRQERIKGITQEFPGLLLRMALIYRVAVFDAFLTDIQLCVLTQIPGLLKNNDQKLTYTEIVEATMQNRLTEVMAEKVVRGIGRNSIAEQLTKLSRRLQAGFQIAPQDEETLTELIARRNLFTHANGIVDDTYRSLVPNTPFTNGTQLDVTYKYWSDSHQLLQAVCNQLLQAIFGKHCPGIPAATV